MTNIMIIVVLLLIVGGAVFYIVKEKKKGAVCIGCPHAGSCGSKKNADSGCGCH